MDGLVQQRVSLLVHPGTTTGTASGTEPVAQFITPEPDTLVLASPFNLAAVFTGPSVFRFGIVVEDQVLQPDWVTLYLQLSLDGAPWVLQ